jgi:hypothetical protein
MKYEVKMTKDLLTSVLTEGTVIQGTCTQGLPKDCKLISISEDEDVITLEFTDNQPPYDEGQQVDVIYSGEATKSV